MNMLQSSTLTLQVGKFDIKNQYCKLPPMHHIVVYQVQQLKHLLYRCVMSMQELCILLPLYVNLNADSDTPLWT